MALLAWSPPAFATDIGYSGVRSLEGGAAIQAVSGEEPSTGIEPYSKNPSEELPFAVCPPPTKMRASCMAAEVPVENGEAVVGPQLQGSGVFGGFSPADLRSAYAMPSKGGAGLTVAITIAYDDPNAESDLALYRSQYGLSPCTTANGCFKKVNQLGEAKSYPSPNSGWALETSLDLDMVSAICPECHIVLVEANSNELEDLGVAVDEAVKLGANVVSDSWAAEEFSGETTENHYFNHPGIPALFASGDWGYGVYYPAASPDVVSVGGTSLTKDASKRGWHETAWSGAGSGCSSYEKKPSWQKDAGCTKRSVADVSAVSDPSTPVSVYDSYKESGWVLLGGTSVATPIMAGVEALSSSAFRIAGPSAFRRVGEGSGLFDVVEGENGACGTESKGGLDTSYLCQADVGYDGPTGWGSPNGPQSLPVAITEAATTVSASEAILHGSVDPRGLPTEYRFEYGATTAYGSSVPVPDASAGSGSGYIEFSRVIAGLKGQTPYHYRIVAKNTGGTFYGVDRTFGTTPPTATTGEAGGIGAASAVLHASVDPEGLETSYYFEYGPTTSYSFKMPVKAGKVGSGTANVSVESAISELTGSETYHYRVTAQNIAGVAHGEDRVFTTGPSPWTAETPPSPGENITRLNGVTCAQANLCIAVGKAWRSYLRGDATLAERWDGKSWSVMNTPNPPGALNKGESRGWGSQLNDVSCVSTTNCIAVGYYQESIGNFEGRYKSLAEHWNGSEWSIMAVPAPSGNVDAGLEGVSCVSATACVAVGDFEEGSGSDKTLAVSWDGTSWTIQPTLSPAGYPISWLRGVSCSSSTSCTAVGAYGNTRFQIAGALAMRWDGTSWTIQSTPPETESFSDPHLEDVSCASANACTAVGYYFAIGSNGYYKIRTLAEGWNGAAWAAQPTPTPRGAGAPIGGEEGNLLDVSCVSASRCTASGAYYSPTEAVSQHGWRALVERTGDTGWSALEIVSVLPAPSDWWHEAGLSSVSCPSSGGCTVVGGSVSGPDGGFGAELALAEHEVGLPTSPTASFLVSTSNPVAASPVAFDGSASSSPDGTIKSYDWEFGDGSKGSGVTPSHIYAHDGEYPVKLTVTDDEGKTAEVSHSVKVANAPPTASFLVDTPTPTAAQSVAFDGSASSDPDGTIESYSWEFGDGSKGSGVTPSHTYAHGGGYTVTLTVTDDEGATGKVSHQVKVAAAAAIAPLAVIKSGAGAGAVTGNHSTVNCGAACAWAEASLYEGAKVVLAARPAFGSTFVGWSGAGCTGTGTCEVTMSKVQSQSVTAEFTGTAMPIVNPKTLTLKKATGTGAGTVKATGLACRAACVETEVAYTGGATVPKPKPAALVTLTATPEAGSAFTEWSGCEGVEGNVCKVTMSEAQSVTAQFSALPVKTLALTKPGTGAGMVSSKPSAINCAAACSSSDASFYEGATVVLTAKPETTTGSTFTGWKGCDEINGEGKCIVSMTSSTKVAASFGGTAKPIANPKTLTLKKAPGTGAGTVKGAGLTCSVACVETKVAYTSGATVPKPKPAALVTLTATPGPGSVFTEWSGCEVVEGNVCKVMLSEAQSVTARFDE